MNRYFLLLIILFSTISFGQTIETDSCTANYYSRFISEDVEFEMDTHGTIYYTKQNQKYKIKTLYGRMCANTLKVGKINDTTLLIEVGNANFEGHYKELVVLFINTGDYLVFDNYCMNWEDYLELSDDKKKIHYYCEYTTEKGYRYTINLDEKSSKKERCPENRQDFVMNEVNTIKLAEMPREEQENSSED